MKNLLVITLFIGSLIFNSCQKERDFNGTKTDIENFVGEDLVEVLDNANFKMYYGDKPPQIQGQYLINPAELLSSTVPNDIFPRTFNDLKITFSNQKNIDLTIDYEGDQSVENSVGKGTFITGDGKFFTVFIKTETTKTNGGIGSSVTIVSGEKTNKGIKNTEVALFLLEIIEEDPVVPFIPENTGRIIVDGNGLSNRI